MSRRKDILTYKDDTKIHKNPRILSNIYFRKFICMHNLLCCVRGNDPWANNENKQEISELNNIYQLSKRSLGEPIQFFKIN